MQDSAVVVSLLVLKGLHINYIGKNVSSAIFKSCIFLIIFINWETNFSKKNEQANEITEVKAGWMHYLWNN